MSRGLDAFLQWCAAQGIEIDARLELRCDSDGGMGVYTRQDASIGVGESLVTIPKTAVFSTKACAWSRDAPAGEDPSLDLALALLAEMRRGTASRWYPYFNSLPAGIVDVAVFWGVDGSPDGVEARAWTRGTELDRLLEGGRLLARVNAFFEQTVRPALGVQCSLHDFHRAYSLVSSRAFLVDAYHGLALVPVADAFNHIEDNHVHLESDYHVCGSCGSLAECEHDGGSPDADGVAEDTCEMVARSPVGPGVQVFNSYEAGLTNAELLCQYGFALGENEHNVVRWSLREVLADQCSGGRTTAATVVGLWAALVRAWPRHAEWDGSELVYNTECDGDGNDDGVPTCTEPGTQRLTLNADGQISHALWLLLVTLALPDIRLAPDEALARARQVALGQERPALLDVESGDVLGRTAAAAVRLCDAKLGSVHHAELLQTQLVDILLDDLPPERELTRRSLAFALEERQLLEAGRRAWLETCADPASSSQ